MASTWCLTLATLLLITLASSENVTDQEYLQTCNENLRVELSTLVHFQWNFGSNITEENEKALTEATKKYDSFRKEQFSSIKNRTDDFSGVDESLRRQYEKLVVIGTSALEEDDALKFQETQLSMENIYSTAKIDVGNQTGLSLEPELSKMLASSTNETELREIWTKFRDETGAKMREKYITYYKLGNKAATLNKLPGQDFQHFDDLWMFAWETDDLKKQVDKMLKDLMPLYKKIHAYVRFHLNQTYKDVMPKDGTIPAHLLGNMWAQQWSNILNTITDVNPHNDVDPIDANVNKKIENMSVEQMFRMAEKFFADIGMDNMTSTFWEKSIIEKPEGISLTCHASAWDFYNGEDFRIKQCTEKDFNDLVTVHHEMGHIQYFMEYRNQPTVYREGANPGFHEAIGDLIALAVSTPKHLTKVGLLDKITDEEEMKKINLNYQLKMSLDKVVFLPFSYVMDKWRWDVFGDPSMENNLNRHWWELRIQHQGISPPVKRSENDFDPGAKYHIPAGVEYVRYFVSHVLQFQFYQHMCQKQTTNLYECDFDGDKEAGKTLIDMLRKGSSEKWPTILEEFIGTPEMSLKGMLTYFKPLETFLDDFIKNNNITVGWNNATIDDYMNSFAVNNAPFMLLIIALFSLFLFI